MPETQKLYDAADVLIIVGFRLRGNETRNNGLRFPRPVIQIDADVSQGGRIFAVDMFIHEEARLPLGGLLDRLPARLATVGSFADDFASARRQAEANLEKGLGPYEALARHLSAPVYATAFGGPPAGAAGGAK